MLNREAKILLSQSFFLFGARGTGKSTLLKEIFKEKKAFLFDLLDNYLFLELSNKPGLFEERVRALAKDGYEWFIIDEVQKLPRILDSIHRMIFDEVGKFAITGSSARKLRRGAANLLAGRAFLNYLYPLSYTELTNSKLGDLFNLKSALSWGTLPKVALANNDEDRKAHLGAYAYTYLKEEISEEQVVRQLEPFRRFLSIAAEQVGKIINFSKIARDVGVSTVTVQSYFQILEDTLIGYILEPYHSSLRKRQRMNPKFYLFDCGITRALTSNLGAEIDSDHKDYGALFEQFIINEIIKKQHSKSTYQSNYYLRTEDSQEIDLIVEGGGKTFLIEIKSSMDVDNSDLKTLKKFQQEIPNSIALCLCQTSIPREHENVTVINWMDGIERITSLV